MKRIAYRLKSSLAIAFLATYFGFTVWCLYRQAMGDASTTPLQMLFTWDMYPNYSTFEFRRSVIALTKSGKFLQLVPGRMQQYRGGLFGDMSRLDHLPGVDAVRAREFLRQITEQALALQAEAQSEDPFTSVLLVESYWPETFNLPDDWFADEYGRPNPHRKSWRLIEQAVIRDGKPNWRPLR